MIPILFPADAETFTTQGLGALSGAISCIVTEVANGEYELEMEYPVSGIHFEEIQKETIIYQIPSPYRAPQPFRVYKIAKEMDGVAMVYANHISYDLRGVPVKPFSAQSAAEAMSRMEASTMKDCPFSFNTDKDVESAFSLKVPTACRSVLGGISGSILDVYGGEYLFDTFVVKLMTNRGSDNGVTIRYGKNLTDMVSEENALDYVTGIVPFWQQEDVVVYGDIQWKDDVEQGRAIPKDFSESFEEEPTVEELEAAAKAYVDKLEGPKVSIEVEFENLAQMSGYEGLEQLEKCDLFDTVTVQHGSMGVNVKAKIVEVKTDALLERYKSVTVGTVSASIAQTIVDQQKELQEKTGESQLKRAVDAATAALTGTMGGNLRFLTDDNGHPTGFVIMDTDDVNTAQKVWRYNLAGWGVSRNGINGQYEMAATLESGIVADMITAGTLQGIKIIGDTGSIGGLEMSKSTLSVTFRKDFPTFTQDDLDKAQAYILGTGTLTDEEFENYDVNMDGRLSSLDLLIMQKMINGQEDTYSEGTITISATDPKRCICIEVTGGYRAGEKTYLGFGGVSASRVVADAFACGDKNGLNTTVSPGTGLTVQGGLVTGTTPFEGTVLWSGAELMGAGTTITLAEAVSDQPHGIVLAFSDYRPDTGVVNNWNWSTHFVPKWKVANHSGAGQTFLLLGNPTFSYVAAKYLNINDGTILGNANNTLTGTGASGITYNNNYQVLRYVLGV